MKVVIRTDSSQKIGSGHVMRCLSLAEELRKSCVDVEFIVRNHIGNINKQIEKNGFQVNLLPKQNNKQQSLAGYEKWLGLKQSIDANETIQIIKDREIDWLIIDHYALDYNWEEKLRPYTKNIMVIDDLANRKHDCDFLLDQNYIHDDSRYDCLLSPDTVKLLGSKYALLRKEFIENNRIQNNSIKKILIFFGGSDPYNLTLLAIKALTQPKLKHLYVDVVIGDGNPHQSELKKAISEYSNITLHIQIDNIAELMSKADLALGAGGVTTWERMAIGLPAIIITTADNQIASTKDLDEDGYIKWLGNVDKVDEQIIYNELLDVINNNNQLQEQSQKCKELVDAKGVQIVSGLLTNGPDPETISVRRAKLSDMSLYWHWANDKVVRRNAFNQQTIKWREHQEWYKKKLGDPNATLLLIESNIAPIGQVCFDRSSLYYTISYSLAKQFRGFNLGWRLLKNAIDYLKVEKPFILAGKVKDNNMVSIKIFKKLGFSEIDDKRDRRVRCFELKIMPSE